MDSTIDLDSNRMFQQASNLFEVYLENSLRELSAIPIFQAQVGASPRSWKEFTYQELNSAILNLIQYLKSLGLAEGGTCAICSNTCPEWLVADMSILGIGAITVAVYTSLPTSDIGYILQDSHSRICFAENQAVTNKLIQIHEGYVSPDGALHDPYPLTKIIAIHPIQEKHTLVVQLSEILAKEPPSEIPSCPANRDSIASLVYTSGSTGTPKGVMQTHGNHLANLEQVSKAEVFGPGGSLFLYLPLAHSFARLIGFLGLFTDTSLKMPAITDTVSGNIDLVSISQDLRAANCEYVPSIPRLFEKAKMSIERKAHEKNFQGWLLRKTLDAAKQNYQAKLKKSEPSFITWFWYAVTEPLRFKLKETVFGKNIKHAISGGAKLSPDVNEFFECLNVKILQGYGLTETCVATNVNRPHDNRIGTVGPVFDGIEIKITPEGEICFRGPNVTKGYWEKPAETSESWDSQGWFHTGDLGSIDQDGYLTITGRKKEVIVSAGGKKIPPQKVEKLLESIPEISHAVLYGNDRPFCVALLVPTSPLLDSDSLNVHNHPEIWKKIEKINEQLAPFEQIKRARFVPEEFSIENGMLTPTHKIKRHAIRDRYQSLIWEMYDNVPHPGAVEASGTTLKREK